VLSRSGIIYNANTCSLITEDFQTLPELLGHTSATLEAAHVYVPNKFENVASHELPALKETVPPVVEQFNEIQSQVATTHRMIDISLLLYFSRTSIDVNNSCAGTSFYPPFLHRCYPRIRFLPFAILPIQNYIQMSTSKHHPSKTVTEQNPTPCTSSAQHDSGKINSDDLQKQVTFIMYPLWHTKTISKFFIQVHINTTKLPYLKKLSRVPNSKKGPTSTKTLKFRNDSAQLHREKRGL